jgi:hypothetical protein
VLLGCAGVKGVQQRQYAFFFFFGWAVFSTCRNIARVCLVACCFSDLFLRFLLRAERVGANKMSILPFVRHVLPLGSLLPGLPAVSSGLTRRFGVLRRSQRPTQPFRIHRYSKKVARMF